ncbi:MAG: MBL fold metallo-hydrolase, partial [Deinococcota bacterium]|nr:MBL fold metallo-hydrolase [Deinococcota bacterium]
MRRLSENLYLFEDTCCVYLVKSGREGVLVDFGSGAVLEGLEAAGVTRVTDILMTHHHRDQGQGLAIAAAAGIRLWVPHAEQDLFHSASEHWQAREFYSSYNNRQDRFSLLESVPVTGTLEDYASYHFGDHTFQVVPTPGHTTGSLSLLADIDGQRVAFTGDLIAGPGKVWSLAATQWSYNGAEGVAASVASLLDLKERAPERLLPSHGEPITAPEAAIDLLVERLWALLRQRGQNPRLFSLREAPFERLTPHLLRNRTAMAYHYVLLSGSGKALFIDFGYDFVTGVAAGADRASRRPWLYSLPALTRDFGVTAIDVALPTHYHDDHVAGLNLLRDVHGTKVWAAETFADVLERPERYDLPCLWYDPIPVDRVLPLGEPIHWEEYTLTLYPQPGHTLYAMAVMLEVDGKRVLAIGDQYQGGEEAQTNYVYKNGFGLGDYIRSAELYRKLEPDLILSGHWDPLWVTPGYFDTLDARGEALARLHHVLLPLETVDFGASDAGVTIRPYQAQVAGAQEVSVEVEVRNPFATIEEATV